MENVLNGHWSMTLEQETHSTTYEERLEWSLENDATTRNSAVGRMSNVLNGHWNMTLEQDTPSRPYEELLEWSLEHDA
ncbi:hypothetical protein DPMN_087156 [Dreissena polymorpha]|uniref:Uncharacterized protein n=1 Tax=Dreissena polymorpha TaxID=45954 RepID=A0A9D4QWM4_DREPO|nr:hypothetical protein DPMN_087156 [Dreissena polymorpha]